MATKRKRSIKSIGRNKLILVSTILLLVTLTFGAWINGTMSDGDLTNTIMPIIIVIVMLALMIPAIIRMARDIKRGEPLDDERSRKVKTKAAATSYYIALYWLLAISFASDYLQGITVSGAIGVGIAGMAVSWGISLYIYNKRL